MCAALLVSAALVPTGVAGPAFAANDTPPDTAPVTDTDLTPQETDTATETTATDPTTGTAPATDTEAPPPATTTTSTTNP